MLPSDDPGRAGSAVAALGRVATPVGWLLLGSALTEAAGAAAVAAGALGVLPAAAAGAGAAIGALTLATSGFSDTISDLAKGDLEKFSEDIQKRYKPAPAKASVCTGSTARIAACSASCSAACIIECAPPKSYPWSSNCEHCVNPCMDKCTGCGP